MERADAIAKGIAAIQAGNESALGGAFDDGAANQAEKDGSVSQGQLDAANKQIADLTTELKASQDQDAVDAAAAQAAQAQVSSLSATIDQMTSQISTLTTKLAADDAILLGLKNSLAQLQAVEAALQQIIPPTP